MSKGRQSRNRGQQRHCIIFLHSLYIFHNFQINLSIVIQYNNLFLLHSHLLTVADRYHTPILWVRISKSVKIYQFCLVSHYTGFQMGKTAFGVGACWQQEGCSGRWIRYCAGFGQLQQAPVRPIADQRRLCQ